MSLTLPHFQHISKFDKRPRPSGTGWAANIPPVAGVIINLKPRNDGMGRESALAADRTHGFLLKQLTGSHMHCSPSPKLHTLCSPNHPMRATPPHGTK
eukprot:3758240-Amphidinium_carterae.1